MIKKGELLRIERPNGPALARPTERTLERDRAEALAGELERALKWIRRATRASSVPRAELLERDVLAMLERFGAPPPAASVGPVPSREESPASLLSRLARAAAVLAASHGGLRRSRRSFAGSTRRPRTCTRRCARGTPAVSSSCNRRAAWGDWGRRISRCVPPGPKERACPGCVRSRFPKQRRSGRSLETSFRERVARSAADRPVEHERPLRGCRASQQSRLDPPLRPARRRARGGGDVGDLLATTSIALLGAAGAGKTHIFARLRRSVGARASFALVRPLLGAEPTLRLLLTELMDQMRRPTFGGSLSQLEAMVGSTLAPGSRFPSAGLTEVGLMDRDEQRARIDETLVRLLGLRPELEGISEYIRRLLGFSVEAGETKGVLTAWLSGRDVEPEAARAAGLPGPLSDVDVLRAITAIAGLAATGAPVLIAFDQLENLADSSGDRVRAHGNLVAELVDQVPALTLVQLALTGEWLQHIQPSLSLPQRSRVAEQTVLLEEPTVEDRKNLVRAWLEALPDRALPDAPSSPLAEADVERWCREPGMTPRMLLQACRRALEALATSGVPVEEAITIAPDPPSRAASLPSSCTPLPCSQWTRRPQSRCASGRRVRDHREEASRLDSALARAWRSEVRSAAREIRDARGEGRLIDVERLAEVLTVTVSRDGDTALVWRRSTGASPFLIGTLASGNVRGNVVLVQGSHPRSVSTALERARDLIADPLLFVRQGSCAIAPTWREVGTRVTELQELTRTCWLTISDDVLADGLAFASMLAASRSGELTGPSGETVPDVALRAWSSVALGDSVYALEGELRRVLAGWHPLAPGAPVDPGATDVAAEPPKPPGPDTRSRRTLGAIGTILERAAAQWGWSEASLRISGCGPYARSAARLLVRLCGAQNVVRRSRRKRPRQSDFPTLHSVLRCLRSPDPRGRDGRAVGSRRSALRPFPEAALATSSPTPPLVRLRVSLPIALVSMATAALSIATAILLLDKPHHADDEGRRLRWDVVHPRSHVLHPRARVSRVDRRMTIIIIIRLMTVTSVSGSSSSR